MLQKTLSGRRILGQALPFVVLAACVYVLSGKLNETDFGQVAHAWSAIRAYDWAVAGLFTLLSFYAVSQYDVIAHRQLDTGLPAQHARYSGMTAVALSQTFGFGLVTGTLARWRMLRGISAGQAALVTAAVSLSFMVMITLLAALACLTFPTPSYLTAPALLALAGALGVLALAIAFPNIRLRGHAFEVPGLRAMFAAGAWAGLDVLTAAVALWMLIPEAARPDFIAFLPAFLLALGAGLYSGTPGGVGPFELVLLALTATGLPAQTHVPDLLVAIVGFRLVYFAIPACIAVLALLRPAPLHVSPRSATLDLSHQGRAELGVIRQNGGHMETLAQTPVALWPTAQALVGLFDPVKAPTPAFFDTLESRAHDRNRFALLYKTTAPVAIAARHAGWVCLKVAHDAIVDAQSYTRDVPERSGLRRKLRKASRGGVTVRLMRPADVPELTRLDAEWQDASGAARGGTMGRFCLNYLSYQTVIVAEIAGRMVAFASFHRSDSEWALDLVRPGADAPDGTMHMLVDHAIELARDSGAQTVSLAAVPACANTESAFWRWVAFKVVKINSFNGLRQFKSSFAPRWMPLYLAAPNAASLCIATLDVARQVLRPRPIEEPLMLPMNATHNEDENYEVASSEVA